MFYEKQVDAGIALLDEKYNPPRAEYPEWDREINLYTLDMGDRVHCVLGQMYGDFCDGRRRLGLYNGEDIRHGFFVRKGLFGTIRVAFLTRTWIRKIQVRRDARVDAEIVRWRRDVAAS